MKKQKIGNFLNKLPVFLFLINQDECLLLVEIYRKEFINIYKNIK